MGSAAVEHRLSCPCQPPARRTFFPRSEIKPTSPALQGRVSSTGLPGKSLDMLNLCPISQLLIYNFGLIFQVGVSSVPQASLSINSELRPLSFLTLCFLGTGYPEKTLEKSWAVPPICYHLLSALMEPWYPTLWRWEAPHLRWQSSGKALSGNASCIYYHKAADFH